MDKMVESYSDILKRIPSPYGWSGVNAPEELERASRLWVAKAGARSFPGGFQYSPAVNPHWEWGAILSGGLEFEYEGGGMKASEGCCYIMPPDIRLIARPVGEPFLVWVEVAGDATAAVFERIGGDARALVTQKFTPEQVRSVMKIARLLHEHPYGYGLQVQASLWDFLAVTVNPGSDPAKNVSPEIQRVLTFLERDGAPERCTLEKLSKVSGLPVETFRKRFNQETGCPPVKFMLKLQIKKAKELLGDGRLSVKQIALEGGFEDQYYFSRLFKQYEGLSPTEYRRRFYPEI